MENRPPTTSELNSWNRWCTVWSWVARANAWQDELDRIAREEEIEAVREMRKRHIEIAQEIQKKARERLAELTGDKLSPKDVLTYLVEAVKMERVARGEPEYVTRTEAEVSTKGGPLIPYEIIRVYEEITEATMRIEEEKEEEEILEAIVEDSDGEA